MLLKIKDGDRYAMPTTSIKMLVCLWTLDEMEMRTRANYQEAIIFIMIKRSLKKNPNIPATFKKFQNILSFTDRTKKKKKNTDKFNQQF